MDLITVVNCNLVTWIPLPHITSRLLTLSRYTCRTICLFDRGWNWQSVECLDLQSHLGVSVLNHIPWQESQFFEGYCSITNCLYFCWSAHQTSKTFTMFNVFLISVDLLSWYAPGATDTPPLNSSTMPSSLSEGHGYRDAFSPFAYINKPNSQVVQVVYNKDSLVVRASYLLMHHVWSPVTHFYLKLVYQSANVALGK